MNGSNWSWTNQEFPSESDKAYQLNTILAGTAMFLFILDLMLYSLVFASQFVTFHLG